MSIEFYEQRFNQSDSKVDIDKLMTEEEQERVAYYVKKYEELKETMSDRLGGDAGWEKIEQAYKGEREDKSIYSENKRVINIMLPQIEGQLANMTNTNLQGIYRGRGYSDQKFAMTASKVGDFILGQNNIRSIVKRFGRRYLKFGTGVLTVSWNKDLLNGQGLPKIECVQTSKVFVDNKVADVVHDINEADFIIHEVGDKSIDWARREYGDDIADAIQAGMKNKDFGNETENKESFTYLRVWTRNNEKRNLELLEISMNGILLSDSGGSSPYYKHVFNKYPFFFAGMYQLEDDSYYFGDGYILLPYQEYINKLLDEIIRAVQFSSQGRTFVDPTSGINPDDLMSGDPSIPIITRNVNLVRTERGAGINEVVFTTIQMMFQKVQEATRFSALMTGNSTGEVLTATQAGIQTQQGATGIDDKKKDLSQVFGEALNYAIGLTMQFWNSAQAFRVTENEDSFEWVDVREFKEIPEMIPASSKYKSDFKRSNPTADTPEFMQLEKDVETGEYDEMGNPVMSKQGVTKQLELDIQISIGEGLPVNKMAVYNIVRDLAQFPLFDDETGQMRPLITFKRFRELVELYFGLTVDDMGSKPQTVQNIIDTKNQAQAQVGALQEQLGIETQQPFKPMNTNPNIPNANLSGSQISTKGVF